MGTSDASSNLSMKERREKGLLWPGDCARILIKQGPRSLKREPGFAKNSLLRAEKMCGLSLPSQSLWAIPFRLETILTLTQILR